MYGYDIADLLTVAKRENNGIRSYLYVNPIQGKHIPVSPNRPLNLFRTMAKILDDKYPDEKLLIIGFAETATAIGAGVAEYSSQVEYCTQTTREKYDGAEYLYFTESHSHAIEQSLIINGYNDILKKVNRIILVEDEVTTGNTICNLISELQKKFQSMKLKFSIISILNSMTNERISKFEKEGIDFLFVERIPFEYKKNSKDLVIVQEPISKFIADVSEIPVKKTLCNNLRYIQKRSEYSKSVKRYIGQQIRNIKIHDVDRRILILGTEEFMYPPMRLANVLKRKYPQKEIRFHATTRSPILVSANDEYPLHCRNQLVSPYDKKRITYVYNLEAYDMAIVLTDAESISRDSYGSIYGALSNAGCKKIILV